jgi:hypothetical protein
MHKNVVRTPPLNALQDKIQNFVRRSKKLTPNPTDWQGRTLHFVLMKRKRTPNLIDLQGETRRFVLSKEERSGKQKENGETRPSLAMKSC